MPIHEFTPGLRGEASLQRLLIGREPMYYSADVPVKPNDLFDLLEPCSTGRFTTGTFGGLRRVEGHFRHPMRMLSMTGTLLDVTGRTAWVTGGAGGLGRPIALGLAGTGGAVPAAAGTAEGGKEAAPAVRAMNRPETASAVTCRR